jgi:hypothetical protein
VELDPDPVSPSPILVIGAKALSQDGGLNPNNGIIPRIVAFPPPKDIAAKGVFLEVVAPAFQRGFHQVLQELL